ncbi:MAG: LysE/ArgO family amino acid transporter [Endozoicomonas sp.]
MVSAFLQGFSVGGGLILAIGGQNAFLLTQGLKRQHHLLVASICFVCDVSLIFAGVMGLGTLIVSSPVLLEIARWGGVLFLGWMGLQALLRVFKEEHLETNEQVTIDKKAIITTTLAVTLLNPHVYLDTVVMIGSIGAQQGDQRVNFALGAATASMIWFYSLGLGAAGMAPLVKSSKIWKVIDTLVCLVMWSVALSLVMR